jgi:hypothetical protein
VRRSELYDIATRFRRLGSPPPQSWLLRWMSAPLLRTPSQRLSIKTPVGSRGGEV